MSSKNHATYIARFGSDPVDDAAYIMCDLSRLIADALDTNTPIKNDGEENVLYLIQTLNIKNISKNKQKMATLLQKQS